MMIESRFRNRIRRVVLILLTVLTVYRVFLFIRMPYYVLGGSGYDDQYLLTMAEYISKGWWLGDYDYITLIKGASFPLLVAAANVLCISYPSMLALLYVAGALLFSACIKKITKNDVFAIFAYVLILYSPVGFSTITQRLYRNAILFPALIILVSCLLQVYWSKSGEIRRLIKWSLLLGLSYAFFYYIREDSIWSLPLFAGAIILALIWILAFSGLNSREKAKRSLVLLLPFLVFALGSIGYKSLNYYKYGVFTVNDRTHGAFAALTGDIIKIRDDENTDFDYWITRKTMEAVADECPSLKDSKELILERYDAWTGEGETDIKGDISVWAFREALAEMGCYSDAKQIEEFCLQVDQELQKAVSDGRLEVDEAFHFSTQCRGIERGELSGFIKDAVVNMNNVLFLKGTDASLEPSPGSDDQIRYCESITAAQTIHEADEKTNLFGWGILKGIAAKDVRVIITGDVAPHYCTISDAENTCRYFSEYPANQRFRFSVTWNGKSDAELGIQIWNGDRIVFEGPLETIDNDTVYVNIDYLGYDSGTDPYQISSSRIIRLSNDVIKAFKLSSYLAVPLSALAFAVLLCKWIKSKKWVDFERFIIPLGILASAFALEFGVTVFCSWGKGMIWGYSAPGVLALGQSCFLLLIANLYNSIHLSFER